MMTNDDKKVAKSGQHFFCIFCDYNTSRINHYTKHLSTLKHKMMTNDDAKVAKVAAKNIESFSCCCGKKYKYRQGLFTHKQKCKFNETKNDDIKILTNCILNVMKDTHNLIEQNQELTNKIVSICKHNSSITNINSNNKTFNLNVFLNEECKDAMNIMDFVNSLNIQLSDFENVGKMGYVEGISNIIIKNLKALEINKRPVHCSDSKRETMYIKDDNKWEKDNVEKDRLRRAIKYIAHKNTKLIPEFREKYPDCIYSDSKKSDQYNKLIIEAMGGKGENECEKEDKIIKNIAKEVIINK